MPWFDASSSFCPESAIVQTYDETITRLEAEKLAPKMASEVDWTTALGFRTRIEPEVKEWSREFHFQKSGKTMLCLGSYKTPFLLNLTLKETNGKREWSISEVDES